MKQTTLYNHKFLSSNEFRIFPFPILIRQGKGNIEIRHNKKTAQLQLQRPEVYS